MSTGDSPTGTRSAGECKEPKTNSVDKHSILLSKIQQEAGDLINDGDVDEDAAACDAVF